MELVTMTVANVRVLGTEGRPAPTITPPQDKVYDLVVFKGNDIIDLYVVEEPSSAPPVQPTAAVTQPQAAVQPEPHAAAQPQPAAQPEPSAPSQSAPAASQPDVQATMAPPATEQPTRIQSDETPRFIRPPTNASTTATPASASSQPTASSNGPGGRGARGRPRGARGRGARGRGGRGRTGRGGRGDNSENGQVQPQNFNDPLEFKEDFDFETSIAKMENLQLDEPVEVAPAYNPDDDFFDTISRTSRDDDKRSYQQERQYNADTFGKDGYNHRGRSRGRGRRGRGRGRRGGRGGRGGRSQDQGQNPASSGSVDA
eukprot:TRINITY_DN11956_c0_g3_i3.p1 TRINITY_DN11956_c0_g3~~TRINITY_DN11956_c0_g3_i3.p1  ORF type:complete len:344 (+),score=61.21 TRINITY_DN11956_c0_g3_i3:89-1033(+)